MNDALNLDKPKTLTIDDLVFEHSEEIGTVTPVVDTLESSTPPEGSEESTNPTVVTVEKPKFEDLDFGDITDDNKDTEKDPEKTQEAPEITQDYTLTAIRAVLKQKMDRYGIDAEDADISKMTEEELVDFEENLDQAILENKWNNLKTVDKNVDKLVTFLENGGDPKDMISLFKEQDTLAKIDISTEDGQERMIRSYYSNILGWDSEKTNKKLERLAASGMLQEEAQDVEEAYNEHFEKKQEEITQAQQNKIKLQQQKEQQRKMIFEQSLNTSKIPKKLADEFRQTAFGKGVIKGTNEEITILDYKIKQMQTNPEMFLKLVQFATDPTAYDNLILQTKKNEEVTVGLKKQFQVPTTAKPIENTQVKEPGKKTFKFNL